MIMCFVLPALFTTKHINESTVTNAPYEENNFEIKENNEGSIKYEYKKYATIKLLHTETSEIEELPLDTYLYNVVSSEMPADFEIEALKAQAVVARTYTIYQIEHSNGKHEGADICDNPNCCQAWISKEKRFERWEEDVRESNWAKIVDAVDSTAGWIITYDGKPIDAFFHSNSGGKTELPVNVWRWERLPIFTKC